MFNFNPSIEGHVVLWRCCRQWCSNPDLACTVLRLIPTELKSGTNLTLTDLSAGNVHGDKR